jgi:hypothetical protein
MYLWGLQVRRERTDCYAPSMKEGPSMSRKKKKKGSLTVIDCKKERLSDERKKIPLDEMKGVHPYGKRGRPTLPLLEPTPDQASRLPTSTTNSATRYDELAGGVGTAHQKVENPDSASGQQPSQTQEPYNHQGRVRPSRVGSKRLSRLRRRLSDERVNNNFCPIQSSEVDTVCRGATGRQMTLVIRSNFIHQLKHHPNNKIRVYQYQF